MALPESSKEPEQQAPEPFLAPRSSHPGAMGSQQTRPALQPQSLQGTEFRAGPHGRRHRHGRSQFFSLRPQGNSATTPIQPFLIGPSSSESAAENSFTEADALVRLPSLRQLPPSRRRNSNAPDATGQSQNRASSHSSPSDNSDDEPLASLASSKSGRSKKAAKTKAEDKVRPLAASPTSRRRKPKDDAIASKDRNVRSRSSASSSSQQDSKSDTQQTKDKPSGPPLPPQADPMATVTTSEDDGNLPVARSSRRGRAKKKPTTSKDKDKPSTSSEDSNGSVVPQPRKKRRLVRGARGGSGKDKNHSGNTKPQTPQFAEDLYTLMKRGTRRAAKPRRDDKRKKCLEKLQQRRAGKAVDLDEDTESSEDKDRKALYDPDVDTSPTESNDDEEGAPETGMPRNSRSESTERGENSDDSDDSDDMKDFIVEDDDAPLGAPAERVAIPFQFSLGSQMPLKYRFELAIEWLAWRILDLQVPGAKAKIFVMTWEKLNDELRVLAYSKFQSSVWRAGFKFALEARPRIENVEAQVDLQDEKEDCMACGRSNHPASRIVSFHGSPYYTEPTKPSFLEDVVSRASPPEDHDRDESGRPIANTSARWFVGSACARNAEMAHTLLHWRYRLMTWVKSDLQSRGYLDEDQLEKRKAMRQAERQRLVDQVLAMWVSEGEMARLFHTFKEILQKARDQTARRSDRPWQ